MSAAALGHPKGVTMNRKSILVAAASVVMAAPRKDDHLIGTHGVEEIGRRQREAERTRGQRKRLSRAASNELVQASGATIDLGHIHPRWLRERVRRSLDAGLTITEGMIARWRSEGRHDVCPGDGRPCLVQGDEQHWRCGTVQCGRPPR